MRAICLKQVFFVANYSHILAEKVKIGSFHSIKMLLRRLTRMFLSVIHKHGQAKHTSIADRNTEESKGASHITPKDWVSLST